MLGESAVAGSVVAENTEIVANGPSPSGMTYGSAPRLPSICISPPGPSVRISPPEVAEPCWLSGMKMPAFMESSEYERVVGRWLPEQFEEKI